MVRSAGGPRPVSAADSLEREVGTHIELRAAKVIIRVEDQVGGLDPAGPESFPEPDDGQVGSRSRSGDLGLVVGSPEVDPLEADIPGTAGKRLVDRAVKASTSTASPLPCQKTVPWAMASSSTRRNTVSETRRS